MLSDRKFLLWVVFALAWGGVLVALVLQHGFDMQPCAWCTVQRGIYLLVGIAALVALAVPWIGARIVAEVTGIAFAVAGIVAAGYQHFVAARANTCGFSGADRLIYSLRLDESMPWLFKATASCSEANLPLFGVPFAIWSAALFLALALALAAVVMRPR
jgi:disulfide bond formation protein DsbB